MKDTSTVAYYAFTRSATEIEYDGVVAYHDSTGPGQDGHGRKTIVPLRTMLSQDRPRMLNTMVSSNTTIQQGQDRPQMLNTMVSSNTTIQQGQDRTARDKMSKTLQFASVVATYW